MLYVGRCDGSRRKVNRFKGERFPQVALIMCNVQRGWLDFNPPSFSNFADIYLRGMRERSMRSGTELAWEIPLTDWSTAGEQGKLVFVVSSKPSLAQFISLFTKEKSSFDRPNYTSTQVVHLKISVKKKGRKEIRFDKQKLFP